MYVGKGEDYLPGISLQELKLKYTQETSDKARFRLKCAYLRKLGESIPTIASITGRRESTISDVLRRFSTRGLTASCAIKQTGQPKKLNPEQLASLKIALINPPLLQGYPIVQWTTALVEYFVRNKLKVSIGRKQLIRMLTEMGFILIKNTSELLEANKLLQIKSAKAKKNLLALFNLDKRSYYWIKQ